MSRAEDPAGKGLPKPPSDADTIRFFESEIRPLLAEHCYSCHGESTQEAGLRLDRRAAILRGTDYGPVISTESPRDSLLLRSVRHESEMPMPEGEEKLSDEQIAAIERWVEIGMPWPDEPEPDDPPDDDPSNHWALQELTPPPIPAIRAPIDSDWPRNEIDLFVADRLAAESMTPSPAADRGVLIRRLHYTLTGLPPTFEQVERFRQDADPLAYERLVDGLLGDVAFGERWARHWLDVARYADTKGYLAGGVERKYPFSFTYRDWVTEAFNDDMPYDDFLRYQIAGDQLVESEGHDRRHLAALGFLTLGRRFLNREPDIIDDRIDVVTRGTMGLTVSCARCHDHKFDPIPTEDYYSLYGVFASSTEPEGWPLIGDPKPGPEYDAFLKQLANRENAVEEFLQQRVDAALSADGIAEYMRAAHAAWDGGRDAVNAEASERKLHDQLLVEWIEFLKSARSPDNPNHELFARWHRLRERLAGNDASSKGLATGELATGELAGLRERWNKASPESIDAVATLYGEFLHASVVDSGTDSGELAKPTGELAKPTGELAKPTGELAKRIGLGSGSPLDLNTERMRPRLFRGDRNRLRTLDNKIIELNGSHPGAPPRAMALVDKPRPIDVKVFIRGNPGRRGDVAPRRFLAALSDDPQNRELFHTGSGRRDLVEAIVDPDNPLTARVIVNRVWMHHFGEPLVETPSDFGVTTPRPRHHALLDHLASELIAGGWSLKALHRKIVTSATYRQRGDLRPEYADTDPENTLWYRANRRRLDFESLRDGILATSGNLDDATVGGRPVTITDSPTPPRRTLYAFIDRQNLPGVFRTFDFANPDLHSPRRHETAVPQQALFMMNSPMVIAQARRLVNSSGFAQAGSTTEKVRWLYRRVLARDPTANEIDRATTFFDGRSENAPPPWDQYALVLIASNEFAFVD